MPPQLSAMLSALGVPASPGEFAAVEDLLGGSFSRLPEIRRHPVAQVDAADMTRRRSGTGSRGSPSGSSPSFGLPG
jgi:hypothetical protein